MKIKNIKKIEKQPVYDISVEEAEHYILENGVVSHNTGTIYSSNNIFIIGKRQDKVAGELQGNEFVINIDKSRFVREKEKISITVSFKNGIMKWSGLFDVALEGGYIQCPAKGWYIAHDPKTKTDLIENKIRRSDTDKKSFWDMVFEKTDFKDYIKSRYMVSSNALLNEQETEDEIHEKDIVEMED